MTAPLTPDQLRRLSARRSNERVKLVVTSLNTVALGIFGTAFIVPAINDIATLLSPGPWILIMVASALHAVAQGVLQFLRSEE